MNSHVLMDMAIRAFVIALLITAFFPVRRRSFYQLGVSFVLAMGVALLWRP